MRNQPTSIAMVTETGLVGLAAGLGSMAATMALGGWPLSPAVGCGLVLCLAVWVLMVRLSGEDAGREGGTPELLAAARGGQPDDLKQIKGVGPKLEATLHGLGVFHLDQIAAWTDAEAEWVDAHLDGFAGRVIRDDWVAQARALVAGEAA